MTYDSVELHRYSRLRLIATVRQAPSLVMRPKMRFSNRSGQIEYEQGLFRIQNR